MKSPFKHYARNGKASKPFLQLKPSIYQRLRKLLQSKNDIYTPIQHILLIPCFTYYIFQIFNLLPINSSLNNSKALQDSFTTDFKEDTTKYYVHNNLIFRWRLNLNVHHALTGDSSTSSKKYNLIYLHSSANKKNNLVEHHREIYV